MCIMQRKIYINVLNGDGDKMRLHSRNTNRIAAAVMSLCMTLSMLPGMPVTADDGDTQAPSTNPAAVFEGITPGVKREADDITMNDYQSSLLNDTEGSRFAGRVWADKTVVAHDDDLDDWNYLSSNSTAMSTAVTP